MKKLILKTDKLNNLDTELIGNGGNSRLDIMLDLDTGEIWADEFLTTKETRAQDIMMIILSKSDEPETVL